MSLKYFFKRIIPVVGVCATLGYVSLFYNSNKSSVSSKVILDSTAQSMNSVSLSKNNSIIESLEPRISNIDKSYDIDKEQIIKNNNYLITASRLAYGESITVSPSLTDEINSMLINLEHASRAKKLQTVEYNLVDSDMTLTQKLRIYSMLNALTSDSFCNTIGKMITSDVSDIYAEHGGIVIFNKNHAIKFRGINSNLSRIEFNNEAYSLFKEDITSSFIALYHLHATTYDEKDFAGPSPLDLLNPGGEINAMGEDHEFVITSLSKGRFNIDYYGCVASNNTNIYIVDLGCYSYNLSNDSLRNSLDARVLDTLPSDTLSSNTSLIK